MSGNRIIGKADSAESSNNRNNQPNPLPPMIFGRTGQLQEDNTFLCFRCSRRFPSLFALGGHQNAHKKERNDELRGYVERRLAMEREAMASSQKPPKPPVAIAPASPPVNVINSMPFHSPIVQVQVQPPLLMAAGGGGGYEAPMAPVLFVPADAMFGPYGPTMTSEIVKDGEGNQYGYHPYKKPVNEKSMAPPLKLFAYEEGRDFGGNAEEDDSASSTDATAAAYYADAPSAGRQINTLKEDLDLSLKL